MTVSPNKGYNLQVTGTNNNTWGITNNSNFSTIDLNLGGRLDLSVAGNSNITVTATQAQNLIHVLTGALTGAIQYILPAIGGLYVIHNETTGAFPLTLITAGGGGTSGTILPQGMAALVAVNPDDLTTKVVFFGGQYFQGAAATGGTANVQTLTVNPLPFNLVDGAMITWQAGASITGTATLNVNSAGAVNMTKLTQSGVVNCVTGDILIHQRYLSIYDALSNSLVTINPTQNLGALASLNIGAGLANDGSGNLTIGTSAALPGSPTTTTQTAGDNSTKIATTAYVATAVTNGTSGVAPLASPAFTGTPTAPTASAGTSNTQLATTAFVNPGASVGTNGYQKLPSGLIIQWGQTGSVGGGGSGSTNFPLTFPNNCFSVVLTKSVIQAVNDPINLASISTSGFGYYNGGTTAQNAFWIAIGN